MDYRWLQRSMYRCRSIIQWCRTNTDATYGWQTLSYPIAFTTNGFSLVSTHLDDLYEIIAIQHVSLSKYKISAQYENNNNTGDNYVIMVGY